MSLRIVSVLLLLLALTVFFIHNDQVMEVNLFFNTVRVSKALLLPSLTLLGFIMGYLSGHYSPTNRQRKKELKLARKHLENSTHRSPSLPSSSLSEEDQKYLE
jgi:uncharacterized integral membrane protein